MATNHPSHQDMALWVLDPDSRELDAAVRRHMETNCSQCSALAKSMSGLLQELRGAVQSEPSAEVLDRALSLVSAVRKEDRVLVAELIQDTVELVGVRDSDSDDRFLLFRAGAYEIDVKIRTDPNGKKTELRGQIYGPDDKNLEGFEVQLTHKSKILSSSRTDDMGEFRLPKSPLPPFSLRLLRGKIEIHTPEISR